MSLYAAANGILETHVTWEDVEADLQEKFCTRATFGDNKKAVNISEMKGFLSRIALIEADWQGVEKGKTLPQKFVLKMPSVLPTLEVTKMMNLEEGQIGEEKLKHLAVAIKECHNAEVAALKILTKLKHPDIPFTKVYSLKPFVEENQLKGYLITDYISNTYNVGIHTSIPADDLISAIRGLATFSALCELLPAEETQFALGRKGLELHFEEFFEGIDPCKKYDKLRDLFDEDHAEKATKVFLHYHKLLPKYTNIGETLGFKMVLNHGDLWQSNMLYSKSEDGHLKLEALIDWQTVTRVSPGLDLAKVLWGCLSAEDRRERANELIEFYRNTFNKVYGKELFSFDEAANGILETHVTWEDVEADLQEKLCTKATFGDNKKAVNISDMKIPSQLALIELNKMMHFGDDNGFKEEKLKNFSISIRECHNTEINVYKILDKFNHPDIPFTKVYSLKSFDDTNQLKGYLITEFVSNIHSVQMHDSIPADDMIQVIRAVATFSALCESLPAEETKFAMGEEYVEFVITEFFGENELIKKHVNIRSIFNENHQETVEKIVNVFQLYNGLLPKYTRISEILGLKLVLNHGDLWQPNMIFSKTENGKLKLEALIDWQTVCRLSPGMDLSMLLLGCLSEKDRREREQELLKCYYNTFTNVYGKELFSFNELLNSYYLYSPVMAMMSVPNILTFIDNAKISEEEKVDARKKGMAKIIAIMEDILDIHEYNLKNFPEFFKV